MAGFNMDTANRLVMQLDDGGYLFPQFELSKWNHDPVILGHGGFSSVYEMVNKERPDCKFALKVIGFEKHTLSSNEFWNTGRIQWILCQDSEYVVRVLDARELRIDIDENDRLADVFEVTKESWEEEEEQGLHLQFVLMEKLERVIAKNRFKKVSLLKEELSDENEILKFALEIGQALNTAHSYNVLHRDIKLENIFWDEQEKVYKLGDFGIAKYSEDGNAETVVYTDGYGAPEIERRLCDYYNITADIYSFGITLYLLFNHLKFPGSEGYYPKVEIQYNPDYVFPALENAPEGITKVIRKMCSYKAEDRYQSMADALSELVMNSEIENTDISEELIDMATKTYREEDIGQEEAEPEEPPRSRAERIEEQKIIDQLYKEDSIKFGIIITIISTLLFRGMHGDVQIADNWLFLALPAVVLFEALFQKVKEFQLFFGALTVGLIFLSAFQTGITMPHIIMFSVVLIGCPVLTVSGAAASGIWSGIMLSGRATFLGFLWEHDLGWLILIALLIAVNRYFHMRIEWEKTTYTRAFLGTYIYGIGFPVMVIAGIILMVLQSFHLIAIPEFVTRMHFIRTGIVSFIAVCILFWRDGYLDKEDEAGDEELENVDNLDA